MVFATLWEGQTLVLHHKLIIGYKLLNFINQHQITRLLTSPPILLSLTKVEPDSAAGQMSTVRMIISGGEPVRDSVEEDIQKLYNKNIYQVYGSSEVITIPTAQNYKNSRPGSIGKIVDGVTLRVLNEQGNDVEPDEVGELYVKMPTVALEYLHEPELSADTFRRGWFKSNDLVKFDKDGFYYFVGRKNDVKKVNGIFVSPIEIELVLLNMPNIKDCMIGINTDDSERPNIIANIVLEDTAQPISNIDVRKFLTSRLETYKIPKVIKFIDAIPRTVTGKKMRSFIQQ
jgi:acyl-coenzyme A synthetase/AMP-(fatty) acid ligase